ECLAPVGFSFSEDHPLDDRDPALSEEHVLGPAQADAARTERVGELRLVWLVRVRADAKTPQFVGPAEQLVEPPIDVRLLRVERARHHLKNLARLRGDARDLHFAGQPVEGDELALLYGLALDPERAPGLVDL